MVKSMTGYGRAQGNFSGGDITIEIKSVNNRYLDCGIKLPRGYGYLEEVIKAQVQKRISRGKVDIYVSIDTSKANNVKISVNQPVAASYAAAIHQLANEYGIKDDSSATRLAMFGDVLLVEKQEQDESEVKCVIQTVTAQALDAFDEMRLREGEALRIDLTQKADEVLELVRKVEVRAPITVNAYRERLMSKMQEVLADRQVDEARIIQEAAIYADKVAVDEETVRLRSHISQLRSMLAEGGVIGRKLDFLMQEMNREANTIGSKSNDVEQAKNVVDIKSELEKIREQIQNIE